METFAKLFGSLLALVYHCFDRIVILGHLPLLTRPGAGPRWTSLREPVRSTDAEDPGTDARIRRGSGEASGDAPFDDASRSGSADGTGV